MTVVSGGTSVMGSRRRAAAIASPARVCAFSRLRSSRSRRSKSSWSVTAGAGVVTASLPSGGGRPITYNYMVVDELAEEEVDDLFHALADRTRRDILRRCATGEPS